ncbi:MAG: flagellar hook-associated protein FlgK [Sterolibacterium sp.]|jgi:flagellar hook-associated protein 1 FlgK|nr:flagellar hook-associated protein FlgK [Sterolibacterium sp.]
MGANALNIGVTGLNVAQMNLNTTGQNIANASTPGYTRQQVVQQANQPMYTGAGFIGQGVNVSTIKRAYSDYLTTQVLGAQAGASEMDRYGAQIDQVVNLMADASSGLSPAMAGFFSALSQLSANPSSTPSRQAFLSEAQSLAARFQSLDSRLGEIRAGVNTQIASEVSLINTYAQQIASINQRILVAQASGTDQPANDLLDQRDQIINDLNKEIRVTVLPQSDGSYSVFIGTGQPLVVGNDASTLAAVPDGYDALRTVVALQLPTGGSFQLPDNQLKGGALGGLLAFRNETLDTAQNTLGRTAIALADSFNDQHKLGMDLTGVLGKDFFSIPAPQVLASNSNTLPNPTVTATISDVTALTTSDYRLTSTGGGNYSLLRLADNVTVLNNGPLPASIEGMSISLSSPPLNGSSFLIRPTRSGASDIGVAITDTRNIAVAAPVRTGVGVTNSGTASIAAGSVTSTTATPPPAAITLRYLSSPTPSLDGFPVGALVDNGGGQLIQITSPTTKVPYAMGGNLSFNGIAVNITGAPVNGDSFTINPQPGTTPGVANTGFAALFGAPSTTVQGAARGVAAPGFPLTIAAGVNDQFDLALNGVAAATQTLAAGTYPTRQALIAGLQAAVGVGATVSADASGQLMITSNLQGGATAAAVTLTAGNAGINALFGGAVTTGDRAVEEGGLVLGNPMLIKAGVNDRFSINVDGAGAQTILVPSGSYTPAALATQLQTTINAQFAAPGVSVAVNGAGHLAVMSNTLGGATGVSLASVANGTGVMSTVGATVTQLSSLPVAPLTLRYDQATNTLSGFPVGTSVSVAGAVGSPFAIDSPLTQINYVSGAAISFNGVSFTIKGAPNNGDTFSVGPNSNGVSDNRNALLLGQLQTTKIINGNSTTFQGSYAAMVNQVGNKAREVQVSGQAQHALADQAKSSRDSVSAVNLDEEAANLLRFQQAYQAAARLISVANKLFDTLLEI